MQLLIIVPRADGSIIKAQVHDVGNEATWAADGGILLEDGRIHAYPAETLLFDVTTPVAQDVLAWGVDGKYVIDGTGALAVVDGWQPPNFSYTPPPEGNDA